MDKQTLKAEIRQVTGRKVKSLRKQGILPANVYGKKVKSRSIQVDLKEFEKVFKTVGETTLLNLSLDSEARPVLIHNVQLDPVSDLPLHVDFWEVDLKEKVTASVPVELTGESSAEKQGLGTVVQYINEIEVGALPGDLLERFVVDVSKLSDPDQAVLIKDLQFDKRKIEIKADLETIVVKVEPPQKVEEVAPAAPVAGEVPVEAELPSEGKTPAEGAEAPTDKESSKEKPQE